MFQTTNQILYYGWEAYKVAYWVDNGSDFRHILSIDRHEIEEIRA